MHGQINANKINTKAKNKNDKTDGPWNLLFVLEQDIPLKNTWAELSPFNKIFFKSYLKLAYENGNSMEPATFFKKRLWHGCFPVKFAKFLRTQFLQNTFGRLLLTLDYIDTLFYKQNFQKQFLAKDHISLWTIRLPKPAFFCEIYRLSHL